MGRSMREPVYKCVANDLELNGAYEVRRQVFVEEQGIPESLVFSGEGSDEEMNVVVKDGESVIGTARVIFPAKNTAKIERMAVFKNLRYRGIGGGIISFLNGELKHRQIKQVVLHAQYTVVEFYKSCGFKESGEPFFEAGIKHIKMEMSY